MKNLFIYDFDAMSATSVLSPPSLLKDSSLVNQPPEDLFTTSSDLSLIPSSPDLSGPAHPFSLTIFSTFTEQGNCDLHPHTQIIHTFNPVISGSFTSDTDFRDAESFNADINHTTSDNDWVNRGHDSNDSFISPEDEDENTTALVSFNHTLTAVQIAEWARHHIDASEMLHWGWHPLCDCGQCISNSVFNTSSLMVL